MEKLEGSKVDLLWTTEKNNHSGLCNKMVPKQDRDVDAPSCAPLRFCGASWPCRKWVWTGRAPLVSSLSSQRSSCGALSTKRGHNSATSAASARRHHKPRPQNNGRPPRQPIAPNNPDSFLHGTATTRPRPPQNGTSAQAGSRLPALRHHPPAI